MDTSKVLTSTIATATLLATILAPAAAVQAQEADKRQQDKNNMRNLGTGLGAAAALEALRGKGTNALILGAGAAYSAKKYNDARKAQEKEQRSAQQQQQMQQRRYGATGQGYSTASSALMATQAEPLDVRVNGNAVSFPDKKPEVVAGRVYVPLRGVLEKMGANVRWDADKRSVIAVQGAKTVMLAADGDTTVDGKAVSNDAPAFIENGQTMVPLRFLAETFGATVDWNAKDREVKINSGVATALNR